MLNLKSKRPRTNLYFEEPRLYYRFIENQSINFLTVFGMCKDGAKRAFQINLFCRGSFNKTETESRGRVYYFMQLYGYWCYSLLMVDSPIRKKTILYS